MPGGPSFRGVQPGAAERSAWVKQRSSFLIDIEARTITMCRTVFISLVLAATPALCSEPIVIELWPGKVPGDIGIKGQETSRIHQSPLVGPTKLITNVTRPTLSIYRPDPGRN